MHTRLQNKSLTLLKQINFTKQTRIKLAGNAVSSQLRWLRVAYRNIGIVLRSLVLAVLG